MAYSYTWEINDSQMVANVSNGFVKKLVYRVKGMDGSEEKARHVGIIEFNEPDSLPSDFIAYDSLTAAKCLEWLTNDLGSTKVSAIENALKAQIDIVNTPIEKVGSPWA
tara:strand:- start:301 stop:627 length:327 start_codon:yes stop_codon:yes gene_type:complete